MNDNEIKDAEAKTQKTVDQKPCFTTSNALVFTNLHNAAAEKAAKAIGISAGSKDLNQFIINSGMSDDGRTISNKNDKMNPDLRFGKGEFEVGIVIQVNATPIELVDDESKQAEAKRKNESAIKEAKKIIFNGIREYFKWFAGEEKANKIAEDKLVEFIPEYNGGKVQVKNGVIVGMKEKDVTDDRKLRVGYKVGYTITYGANKFGGGGGVGL